MRKIEKIYGLLRYEEIIKMHHDILSELSDNILNKDGRKEDEGVSQR